uniref:zinc finger CCCH domain-containing protein 17-like n=1 Tax=Erigeron canadensis TaxID=72917 RepID=UPI001CB95811|nr:zinc finger CCCH domain-containing protein 17-like [Erigeron canadensis]
MVVGGDTNQFVQQEEDEFLKRNTDCVYFLASPLTCKKGSECEYRHSDIARVNPRDCYYWLNGNCLNPKCAFRHPPLDGLLEAEVPTPVGPSVPQAPVPLAKQGVACIFFQKGFCLKGHLCPFLHGPPTIYNNKPVQPVPPNPVTKPSNTFSVVPEKFIQEQKFTQRDSVQKRESLPSHGNQVSGMPTRNGGSFVAMEKKVASPPEEHLKYIPANVAPPTAVNESQVIRSNHGVYETNHTLDNDGMNGKDADEYSREPSPGFDVLVDTEVRDSEYYPNEEQFGTSDFDMGQPDDYDTDRGMYRKQHNYDHYNKEWYAREDRTESYNFARKRYPRDDSPDQYDQSDLRHRLLSKQRRSNNVGVLRSVVSREHPQDIHSDRVPSRDGNHDRRRYLEPCSLSSRLRGRITIPGRSTSPRKGNNLRRERDSDRGRQHRSRYSPGRAPHASSNNSRLRDRIKGRENDDFERRNYWGSRRSDTDSEFTGLTRRSSELKSHPTDDGQSLGKRKYPRAESRQVNESFEGPKPLSEILKQKRGSVISSVNNEDNNLKENKTNNVNEVKEKPVEGELSMTNEVIDVENTVKSIVEDAIPDQELDGYDHQQDEDYDYEQIDGEDYNLEEGEEYFEDEEEGYATGKKENEVYS